MGGIPLLTDAQSTAKQKQTVTDLWVFDNLLCTAAR